MCLECWPHQPLDDLTLGREGLDGTPDPVVLHLTGHVGLRLVEEEAQPARGPNGKESTLRGGPRAGTFVKELCGNQSRTDLGLS